MYTGQYKRKAGELLKEMEKQVGGRPPETGNTLLPVSPKLSDIGISKIQSSRYQQIADVPELEFETFITQEKNDAIREKPGSLNQ